MMHSIRFVCACVPLERKSLKSRKLVFLKPPVGVAEEKPNMFILHDNAKEKKGTRREETHWGQHLLR